MGISLLAFEIGNKGRVGMVDIQSALYTFLALSVWTAIITHKKFQACARKPH